MFTIETNIGWLIPIDVQPPLSFMPGTAQTEMDRAPYATTWLRVDGDGLRQPGALDLSVLIWERTGEAAARAKLASVNAAVFNAVNLRAPGRYLSVSGGKLRNSSALARNRFLLSISLFPTDGNWRDPSGNIIPF